MQITQKLVGNYAFLAVSAHEPNTIIAVKNGSQPIVIGKNDGKIIIASDTNAVSSFCQTIFALEDGEAAKTDGGEVTFFRGGAKIQKVPLELTNKTAAPDKGGFSTFMEKEIFEIPTVIKNIENYYQIQNLTPLREKIARANCVHIAACGTSFHAGQYIADLLEKRKKRARVYIASEIAIQTPYINDGDVAIVISQSGETADTLLALREFKSRGIFTIAVCNVEASSIWRYADAALWTAAGTEVAVASTKAFIAQTIVGEILVKNGKNNFKKYIADVNKILGDAEKIRKTAKKYGSISRILFLGKGQTTVTASEAALKVKEITYRHSEGFPAGELKHGTLALVDNKTLTVCITPRDKRAAAKIKNAIAEVRARKSRIWKIPSASSTLNIIYAQLFALYLALENKLDPDKPRNLAKSVTVD
jgi:glucosamine--fructose-6-phosphate aminotransferase (isomerizing)